MLNIVSYTFLCSLFRNHHLIRLCINNYMYSMWIDEWMSVTAMSSMWQANMNWASFKCFEIKQNKISFKREDFFVQFVSSDGNFINWRQFIFTNIYLIGCIYWSCFSFWHCLDWSWLVGRCEHLCSVCVFLLFSVSIREIFKEKVREEFIHTQLKDIGGQRYVPG